MGCKICVISLSAVAFGRFPLGLMENFTIFLTCCSSCLMQIADLRKMNIFRRLRKYECNYRLD